MHRYRIRRAVAVGSCATAPAGLFLACVLLFGLTMPLASAAAIGVIAGLVMFVLSYTRVRRRTLTVTSEGLEVQRDKYRLVVQWDDIKRVQRRRHQHVMVVEELVVAGAEVLPLDHRGQVTRLPSKLVAGHPAVTRIMVSLYDKQWRHGPIGERLRSGGVPLA